MLYLFDMDGTLISGYMDNPDKAYDRWEVLPGRKTRLRSLLMQGHEVCIVTNQGGVAFGHVTEEQADAKIDAVVRALGLARVRSAGDPLPSRAVACYSDERGKAPWNDPKDASRRKPAPWMLYEAMGLYANHAERGVLFVGDRPEDEQAAAVAGVPFQWADDFFAA